MNIREVELEDLERIIQLGRMFFYESGLIKKGLKYNQKDMAEFIQKLHFDDNSVVLVAETQSGIAGMFAGVVFPWYADNSVKIGAELFMFVDPDFRKRGIASLLMDNFQSFIKDKGACIFNMVSLPGSSASSMYIEKGFSPMERVYSMEV